MPESDDQYACNVLGHALRYAESVTGLKACTDTTADIGAVLSANCKNLATVTANAILAEVPLLRVQFMTDAGARIDRTLIGDE